MERETGQSEYQVRSDTAQQTSIITDKTTLNHLSSQQNTPKPDDTSGAVGKGSTRGVVLSGSRRTGGEEGADRLIVGRRRDRQVLIRGEELSVLF